MKRIFFIVFLFCLLLSSSAQKSRVVSVMQMIDSKKYSEAKEAIELAVWNDRTAKWHRTYYAKGLLCQTAYEEGRETQDSKLTRLYDDQLFLAYDSYEKAIELDLREKINSAIAKNYYSLSNDFRELGKEHYTKKEYPKALRAFEHALLVNNSELVTVATDTNLVYNTAMAAFESKNWDKSIEYLSTLHEYAFAPQASLFLVGAHLHNGDTLLAENVLMEGLKLYDYEETVTMYLVNWLNQTKQKEQAIAILDKAISSHPGNFRFYWARGLVYSEMDKYMQAITSLKEAIELCEEAPPELYYQVGVSYYNIGIDLREAALLISENDEYMLAREKYLAQFREAVKWLELSYELDPGNESTINRLYQLYYQLQMKEKQKTFELLLQ